MMVVLLVLQSLSLRLRLRLWRLVLAACTSASHVHDGWRVAIRRVVVDPLLLVTARWRWSMGCWAILPSAILCGAARCLAIVLCTVDSTNSL
ncbi:hypothetical protein BC831DRAFT_478689, partial [Entophlyctis helioformis]